jgi:hypothetical protein
MDSGDAKKLRQLKDGVAELTLDNRALKDVRSNNF